MSGKVLIVVTNVDSFETTGLRTGLWFSELVHFWNVLEDAGYEMDLVSPSGGEVPLDPQSLIIPHIANASGLWGKITNRYKDHSFSQILRETKSLAEVNIDDYEAIYLTGGHGVMFDYPENKKLASLIAEFYESGKIVSAVCHGPAGLLDVTLSDGKHLVDGKEVTAYSWLEEKLARIHKNVPFNLQEELKARGARYRSSLIPFGTKVIQDGRLITGQNPKSTKKVGRTVVRLLEANHK